MNDSYGTSKGQSTTRHDRERFASMPFDHQGRISAEVCDWRRESLPTAKLLVLFRAILAVFEGWTLLLYEVWRGDSGRGCFCPVRPATCVIEAITKGAELRGHIDE